MAKGSDNKFPKVIITEGSVPSSPTSGDQKLYIDSADHKLKRVNSGGTVTTIETSGAISGATGSTDNAIIRADGTGGATVQSSLVTIDDSGTVNIPTGQTYNINGSAHTHASVAGALVLLEQHAGAGASTPTLNFTTCISATYDEYQIEIVNVRPATDGTILRMLMSTDGGSTYDTTAIYSCANYRWVSSAAAFGGNVTQAAMDITNATNTVSNNASWGITGSLRLYSPGSASLFKSVSGQLSHFTAASARTSLMMVGWYESATAVNAFQFKFSSGDVASGTIRVYGVAK